MTTNDGGPAFPLPPVGTGDPRDGMAGGSQGMSLRDWFAGQALAGLLADPTLNRSCKSFALDAYGFADAMLAARGGAK